MNQNSSWRTAELDLLWSQFTTRSSPTDRRLHNDALNTSAPDSQRMLVPSNQSRRIVIALENVEILRQEKQSCARRGSWSSLPRPPWRTSHTALFPLFSSNAILGSLLLQVYKWINHIHNWSNVRQKRNARATLLFEGTRPIRSRAKLSKHGLKKTLTLDQARILCISVIYSAIPNILPYWILCLTAILPHCHTAILPYSVILNTLSDHTLKKYHACAGR